MKKFVSLILLVLLVAVCVAQNRKYLTFGRDPMIPGGLNAAIIKERGWEPANLSRETFLTMWGARGEDVSGWVRAGMWGAWDNYGRFVLGPCGNVTSINRPPKKQVTPPQPPRPPAETLTIYRDHWDTTPAPPPDVQYRERETVKYRVVRVFSSTIQTAPPINPPNRSSGGGGGLSIGPINKVSVKANGYGAAAAAAAAAASTSSTSTTPTSGAGTSGGSSGSSGSSAGGGPSHSGSG